MRFELTLRDVPQVPDAIGLIREFSIPHVNVTDTAPNVDTVGIAGALLEGIPSLDFVLHVATKHHDSLNPEDALARFVAHLVKAEEAGVRQFLIVSGNPTPEFDSLLGLDSLDLLPTQSISYCVYNPYLDGADAAREDERLVKKLGHTRLAGVYLQMGTDRGRLERGIRRIRSIRDEILVIGSLPVPNEAMLIRLKDRPLHGVRLGGTFFDSVAAANNEARTLALAYAELGIEPLFFMSAFDRGNIQAALSLVA